MLRWALAVAVCAGLVAAGSSMASTRPDAQRVRSVYVSLSTDRDINRVTTLLSTSIVLSRPDWIFVESDGSYAPLGSDAAADVYITIDGVKASNDSMLDWRPSLAPREHSFNAIGAVRLGRGRHGIGLVAEPLAASSASFVVRAGANLSVLVHPSAHASGATLDQQSHDFDFHTFGINNNPSALPHAALLASSTDRARQVVALGAASDLPGEPDSGGDAMLGIYLDGRYPGNDRTTWSVNDHWVGAELVAPLFVQARFGLSGAHSVSFDASELPWSDQQGENSARYRIAAGARFVALLGGMRVAGSSLAVPPWSEQSPWDWVGVGSSIGFPGVPQAGTDVLLARSRFVVPRGDSGVVMFTAKSRVQGDPADEGGRVSLWLELDGRRVGSTGVQALGPQPFAISERSICTSYMTSGSSALKSGKHGISLYGRVDGSFLHLAMVADLPLIFFD